MFYRSMNFVGDFCHLGAMSWLRQRVVPNDPYPPKNHAKKCRHLLNLKSLYLVPLFLEEHLDGLAGGGGLDELPDAFHRSPGVHVALDGVVSLARLVHHDLEGAGREIFRDVR